MRVKYKMSGTAAGGAQTWTTEGAVNALDMSAAFQVSVQRSFEQLTAGRAEFGRPGVACNGPYQIRAASFELMVD